MPAPEEPFVFRDEYMVILMLPLMEVEVMIAMKLFNLRLPQWNAYTIEHVDSRCVCLSDRLRQKIFRQIRRAVTSNLWPMYRAIA
jgi:hypothetical protein